MDSDVLRHFRNRTISVAVADDADMCDVFCFMEDKGVQTEDSEGIDDMPSTQPPTIPESRYGPTF